MLIVLEYDTTTGDLSTPVDPGFSFAWTGLEKAELKDTAPGTLDLNTLINLKVEGGYTVEEIIELRKKGLV